MNFKQLLLRTVITLGLIWLCWPGYSESLPVSPTSPTTVPTPTVTNSQRTRVVETLPKVFNQDTQKEWYRIINLLRSSRNTDFYFYTEGFGGDMILLNDFIRALDDTHLNNNTTFADIIGPSGSAHAMLVCACDKSYLRPGATLLFHQAYYIDSWFANVVKIRIMTNSPFISPAVDHIFTKCIDKGILTGQDLEILKDGEDIVFTRLESHGLKKEVIEDSLSLGNYTLEGIFRHIEDRAYWLFLLFVIVCVIKKGWKK